MKAIRIHGRGGPETLEYEDATQPQPQAGEVLVQVAAAAVIANELKWDETYQTTAGVRRPLPIPGHDFSGVVAAVGTGVDDITIGSPVYALTAFDRDGADAEFCIALPGELAPRPRTLDDIQAAAVPLAALTAWQALFIHAHLEAGQTVLIHGAAGGVGTYAVQLARWAGAQVAATASARHGDYLRDLGAQTIIDYTTERFEDVIHAVDVVFDLVGGETLARSWQVLKPGGILVSVVSPRPEPPALADGARFDWFVVAPNGQQLSQIGELIDAGQIRPVVDQVLPLSEARRAYTVGAQGHAQGKIVLRVHD